MRAETRMLYSFEPVVTIGPRNKARLAVTEWGDGVPA